MKDCSEVKTESMLRGILRYTSSPSYRSTLDFGDYILAKLLHRVLL